MKTHKYTILLYGDTSRHYEFERMLQQHGEAVGVSFENFQLLCDIDPKAIGKHAENGLLCGVYFSSPGISADERVGQVAEVLNSKGASFFPVVHALEATGEELPEGAMRVFNATEYQLEDKRLPYRLIVDIFHAFNITAARRKVFISYKRTESQVVADQLRDELTLRGYEVFLDWISIEEGRNFQQFLMNELHHSDIIVFLQTANIFKSKWVREELIAAELRGVSIFRLNFHEDADKYSSFFADRHHVVSSCGRCRLSDRELNRICLRIESFRIASMSNRRRLVFDEWQREHGGKTLPGTEVLSDMVISRLNDGSEYLVCPYFPSAEILHAFNKRTSSQNRRIYCSRLGYSRTCIEYMEWLCGKTGVQWQKPKSENGLRSERSVVFLSASVPSRNTEHYEVDVPAVVSAVIAMVKMLSPYHRIVFGGHPEINPFVLKAAEAFGTLENITIYQSEFFADKIPEEVKRFMRIEWTDVQKDKAGNPDRDNSLGYMRKSMLENASPRAAVFIGGMDGVEDEYEKVKAENQRRRIQERAATGAESTNSVPAIECFVLGETGGASKILAAGETLSPLAEKLKNRSDYINVFAEINDWLLSNKS